MTTTATTPLHLPTGYQERRDPAYHLDAGLAHVWQPDVYRLAGVLAALGGRGVVDLGCGAAGKLLGLLRSGQAPWVVGVDYGPNLDHARTSAREGEAATWIAWDLEAQALLPIGDARLARSVVVAADVIEHLVDPAPLLANLRRAVALGAVALVSTPERTLTRSPPGGPPRNTAHVREWAIDEFHALLEGAGLPVRAVFLTAENDTVRRFATVLAVCAGGGGAG